MNSKSDIKTDRKPRPSPKGTGRNTGCKHSSIIWPKDVWEALQKEVFILDENGEVIGVKAGMSVNDVAVRSVRKELKVPIPSVTVAIVSPSPATEAFTKITIPSNH